MKLLILGKRPLTTEDGRKLAKAKREIDNAGHNGVCILNPRELMNEEYAQALIEILNNSEGLFLLPDWQECRIANHIVAMACTLSKLVVPANNTIIPKQIVFQTYKSDINV